MPRKKPPINQAGQDVANLGKNLGGYVPVAPDVAASLAEAYPDAAAWEPIPRALTGGRRLMRLKSNSNVIITRYQYDKNVNPRYKIGSYGKGKHKWMYQNFPKMVGLQKKLGSLPDNTVCWICAYGLSTGASDQPGEWIFRGLNGPDYKEVINVAAAEAEAARIFSKVAYYQLRWRGRP